MLFYLISIFLRGLLLKVAQDLENFLSIKRSFYRYFQTLFCDLGKRSFLVSIKHYINVTLYLGTKGTVKGFEMTTWGYQRVSTKEQCLDRQTQALAAHGVPLENIYTDKDSGGKVHRQGLDELLGKVQPGDKVVVLSFDRLARSLSQLLAISEDFNKKGIELQSIKEQIDTTSPCGKLFFSITGAFAQFEKDMNNQRTKEGLAAARNNGVKLGRPKASQEKIEEAIRLYQAGSLSMKDISKIVDLSPSLIYRELKARNITRA